METNQSLINQNSTGAEVQPQQTNSNNSRLFVVVVVGILLTAMISGSLVYFWQRSVNKKAISSLEQKIANLEEEKQSLTVDKTESISRSTISPAPTQLPAVGETKVYTDPDGRYKFSYPSDWKVLNKVPEKFRRAPSYVEGGELEKWLESKMLSETCRGPIVQNISDDSQLIVFETIDAKSTEGFYCWSSGYFMENDKWKRSGKYAYPLGTNNLHEPEWKGDYLKMVKVAENDKFVVIAALINYETFHLRGEPALQSIISSFQLGLDNFSVI